MQPQGQFYDATQFEISNGGGPTHPIGKFPAYVSNTAVKPTKENDGNFLEVEYTTPAGTISQRFNLWNNNAQAVDIAQKQLAALCYATGIFKLDLQNQGREFANARLQIEVRKQPKNENYHEVNKVYDANGNEPSKQGGGGQSQQQPQQQQPQTQPGPQGGGSPWGGGNTQQQPQQQPAQQQPQQQQPQAQPQAQPPNNAGWSPQNQGGGQQSQPQSSAPWGPK